MARDVSIVLNAVDKASKVIAKTQKSFKNLDKTLEDFKKTTDKSAKPFKNLLGGLSNIGMMAATVVGPLVAVGFAVKKAFEFGERGAIVTQTAESFDLLIQNNRSC